MTATNKTAREAQMTTADPNALIRLRNGAEAPMSVVRTSWLAVRQLADNNDVGDVLVALYEARELARNPQHALWAGTGETIQKQGLLADDGKMHEITRNVILSSVIGTGMALSITWPIETGEGPPGA